jgi:hypothetical protein
MFKKVTTVISQNKDEFLQKALVLGGITAGMIISSVLSKTNKSETIVREEVSDVTDAPEPEASAEEEN